MPIQGFPNKTMNVLVSILFHYFLSWKPYTSFLQVNCYSSGTNMYSYLTHTSVNSVTDTSAEGGEFPMYSSKSC